MLGEVLTLTYMHMHIRGCAKGMHAIPCSLGSKALSHNCKTFGVLGSQGWVFQAVLVAPLNLKS